MLKGEVKCACPDGGKLFVANGRSRVGKRLCKRLGRESPDDQGDSRRQSSMSRNKSGTDVTIASATEIWSYVQETSRPEFHACPNCGAIEGQWYGFERIDRARVYRRRKCLKCKRIYRGAGIVSAIGDLDTWEAKWLLRWQSFREAWLQGRREV